MSLLSQIKIDFRFLADRAYEEGKPARSANLLTIVDELNREINAINAAEVHAENKWRLRELRLGAFKV